MFLLPEQERPRFNMKLVAALMAVSLLAGACGGSDEEASMLVLRSLESRQCESGGLTLADVQALALAAGVQVRSASCGWDGLGHVAACGAGDGRIAILEIALSQGQLALASGFLSSASLPFVRAPCQ
jgi:hypothetical protein